MVDVKEIRSLFLLSQKKKYQKFLLEEQDLICKLEDLIKEHAELCQSYYCPRAMDFTKEEWDKVTSEYNGYQIEIFKYFRSLGFAVVDEGNYYTISWQE